MTEEKVAADQIAQWVDEFGPGLFRHAYVRLGDRQLAEDIVQDTFLAAVEKIDTFRVITGKSAWVNSAE